MIRKAIIPAAGLGTRFLPATKAQPKEMLPIVDKPTIQYIVEEAIASGIEDIMIVTGRNKRAIEDHFDRSVELELALQKKEELLEIVQEISKMADIHYIRQKEPLGLGHAVLCARKFVGNEPFAVLLGDDIIDSEVPCLKQLIRVYEQEHKSVVGVQQVDWNETHKYGIIEPGAQKSNQSEVLDLIEKPKVQAPSNIAIMGRYILDPQVFTYLEHTLPGANGEIQLTDALRGIAHNQGLIALQFQGSRYDVGDKFGFLQATVDFALKNNDLQGRFREYLIELSREFSSISS
ncbi:UTP--glucose-1-phosphate uridylyltransferase GalU [Paenibacillus silvae]|uniref:UTP--glucose-1-phosphate uridylyltransferase GalU n=1 Tax=Paenibacillus silvae TaxID=1325358 RepID=UPI0011A781A5|nr:MULTISPECIES: UTP--glucose-1-phosphate uridylyltransferase GalU [Paenibacillus]MCK6073808.1 UTP--glucose-1-phosphate uridylyltransferase GalU [Paenibacillus silvae]MCK6148716.1 UTP--glucose-1-phosphate uridylyltransferase GalU [Paenibacillus silvae]MCK6267016.1 UTP--glucose-1-phosphate uridylyltransferase GalU [Paenibacillus silvae]